MKKVLCVLSLAFAVPFAVACGDSGGSGGSSGSGNQNCVSEAECNNGVCKCTAGKTGNSCGPTIDDCTSQCEVCN